MIEFFFEAGNFLKAHGAFGIMLLCWPMFLFDIPRYLLMFIVIVFLGEKKHIRFKPNETPKFTIALIGYNEANYLERTVLSLLEQTLPPNEIIVVSDGSTDEMRKQTAQLKKENLIQGAYHLDLRGGKSSGLNLVQSVTKNDFIVNIDCDCMLNRHSLTEVMAPFADPNVGAVCGNIVVENQTDSLIATLQAIEYFITISLGKKAADILNQVSCVSGGFGAFRCSAFTDVSGSDAGGGEDLDITMRLRKNNWDICFAPAALCYTNVPNTLRGLINQRFRWERDAVSLRFRKHSGLLKPFNHTFKTKELYHQLEFLFFNIVSAAITPFYLLWIFYHFDESAVLLLTGIFIILFILDMLTFILVTINLKNLETIRFWVFLPAYTLYNVFFMRTIRLCAYIQEWIFQASRKDDYVPEKVRTTLGDMR